MIATLTNWILFFGAIALICAALLFAAWGEERHEERERRELQKQIDEAEQDWP